MPFSKTPKESTYSTKQINLLQEMNSRGDLPTKDVDYINCFPEITQNKTTGEKRVMIRKRDGVGQFISAIGLPRGMYYWEDQAKLYIVVANNINVYSMPGGTFITTLFNVFPTTVTGTIGITEFLYDTGVVKLVVTDGTTLSTIDSANTVVASTSPDLPVHLPQIVFLDGYLFLVKTSSADLYNSNLNDPLLYTPGDFISSEIIPDRATYVTKLNNYILLFGNDSIEYFWDAANATGSPLQRNDTPVKFTGLIGGICQLGSKIYFVGDTNHSQANVFVLEDFKITLVGNETISRFLNTVASTALFSHIISLAGYNFYVLYAGSYTYVMELESQLWHRWQFGTGPIFPVNFSFNCRTTTNDVAVFTVVGNDNLFKFDSSLYQDFNIPMVVSCVLNNEEFDTYNRKTMSRLVIWADKPTASSPLLVQWSDDDYQTFNTGVIVELFQARPDIKRLGQFIRRAFKFTHVANQPLRLEMLEANINMMGS